MLLADLVAGADRVGATGSRTAKRDGLAELLRELSPDEVVAAVGFLVGDPRQGRIGIGGRTVHNARERVGAYATAPTLTVLDLDAELTVLAGLSGPGSNTARLTRLTALLEQATEAEAWFIARLLFGELRQGALEGVMADAIAAAAGVPVAVVRRAAMLSGDLRRTAAVALTEGRTGLEAVGLTVLNPVQPMLASTSEDVATAVADGCGAGATDGSGLVSVEWKLDGARVQVHRAGDEVRIFTRNLNDVTERLPEVVAATRTLPVDRVVLDGEVLGLHGEDRPQAFQDTMSRFGRDAAGHPGVLRPFFFDVLHADGRDLIDEPLGQRLAVLDEVARPHRIPGLVTADPLEADAFAETALRAGHEGVMVKALDSPYMAGRRGRSWRKVKPVRLFDLVVLAAEWGSGRRQGWLSNLHLGARDPGGSGFVMVGKTFKGLTDELLTWQTAAFLERELGREGHVVHVRPELVVEIALDGVLVSTRYRGGIALRFARVKRYRPDKRPDEADTIDALRSLLPG